MATIKLSHGNSKIFKALIWNLPAGKTCPGATELCKKGCYAKASEIRFPNVVPQSRKRNLDTSRTKTFVEDMVAAINCSSYEKFRIHESGDFYSQKYLDDWTKIIKQCPDTIFWAYTKSYKLDFSKILKLKNVVMRYSVDASTEHLPKQKMAKAHTSATYNKSFVCPSTLAKGHSVRCMKDCSFCIESKNGITFRPHGGKKKVFE